jgi:hypothetical protein
MYLISWQARVAIYLSYCLLAISAGIIAIGEAAEPLETSHRSDETETLIGAMFHPLEIAEYCDQMAGYGIKATTLTVAWNAIEPAKGVFRWQRADPVVQLARSCGLTLSVHVLSNTPWATKPPSGGKPDKRPSTPPVDMEDYYNFVFQLASRYRGEISRYSIENEAASPANWEGTPEEYVALLATAHRAVHTADPDAIVLNDGMSSSGLGLLVAMNLFEQGQRQEAVDWINRYFSNGFAPGRQSGTPLRFGSMAEFEQFIQAPLVQRLRAWLLLLAANQDHFDAFQVHYYAPPDHLPVVMDWVRGSLEAQGPGRPIELWELGYGWGNDIPLDPQAQADGIAQLLATAVGEGVHFVIFWRFTDQVERAGTGVTGLVTGAGPRPAAEAFRVAVHKLVPFTSGNRLQDRGNVQGYSFHEKQGRNLRVVWRQWQDQTDQTLVELDRVVIISSTGERITDLQATGISDQLAYIESCEESFTLHLPFVQGSRVN